MILSKFFHEDEFLEEEAIESLLFEILKTLLKNLLKWIVFWSWLKEPLKRLT